MLLKLAPSPDQLRWYVQSALGGFDTLDLDDAIENAKADMRAILIYLDAVDHTQEAVAVSGVSSIKPGVRLECVAGDDDGLDLRDLKHPRLETV